MTNLEFITLMKKEAGDLLDDPPGTNPEYGRALCELIVRTAQSMGMGRCGHTADVARSVGEEIGASW